MARLDGEQEDQSKCEADEGLIRRFPSRSSDVHDTHKDSEQHYEDSGIMLPTYPRIRNGSRSDILPLQTSTLPTTHTRHAVLSHGGIVSLVISDEDDTSAWYPMREIHPDAQGASIFDMKARICGICGAEKNTVKCEYLSGKVPST